MVELLQKRKILFLVETLSGGGAEKVLSTLAKHIDKSKFDITVCSILNCGVYIDEISSSVTYQYLLPDPSTLKSRISRFWYRLRYKLIYSWLPPKIVYNLFLPKGYDVEIAFVEGTSTRIISGSTNKSSKKIAWMHTDMRNNDYALDAFMRKKSRMKRAYSKFDHIVGVSKVASLSLNMLLKSNFVTKVLYNPIDCDEIRSKAIESVNVPAKRSEIIRICSVGRIVGQKAFDRLIRIAYRLKREGHRFEIWIIGTGILYYELKKLIVELSLTEEVSLLGFQSNPYSFMAKSDLFVCSSIAEGYSTAVTEALILGLPVITTDCSGMKELLGEKNEYGMVTENSEDALYEAVSKVFEGDYLNQLKTKAERRKDSFKLESFMQPIEALLES